ncbi:MAG: 50S ribosomal protein L29 [Anaerolineae bacterium]|jgi:large subunit ribosomal protein L29|nr:50S ribosomal protein L29 [Anaerolineae bacterium]
MKIKELRALADDKLVDLYEDTRQEIYKLRENHAIGELKDTSQIQKVRRLVARIRLIQRERELAAAPGAKGT